MVLGMVLRKGLKDQLQTRNLSKTAIKIFGSLLIKAEKLKLQ